MQDYEQPTVKIITFNCGDIIRTSTDEEKDNVDGIPDIWG